MSLLKLLQSVCVCVESRNTTLPRTDKHKACCWWDWLTWLGWPQGSAETETLLPPLMYTLSTQLSFYSLLLCLPSLFFFLSSLLPPPLLSFLFFSPPPPPRPPPPPPPPPFSHAGCTGWQCLCRWTLGIRPRVGPAVTPWVGIRLHSKKLWLHSDAQHPPALQKLPLHSTLTPPCC